MNVTISVDPAPRLRPGTPFDRLTLTQRRIFALVLVDRVSGHPDLEAGPFAERHDFKLFETRQTLALLSRMFPGPIGGPVESLTSSQRGCLLAGAEMIARGLAATSARCAARLNLSTSTFRHTRMSLVKRSIWPFPVASGESEAVDPIDPVPPTIKAIPAALVAVAAPIPERPAVPVVERRPVRRAGLSEPQWAVFLGARAVQQAGGHPTTIPLAKHLGWSPEAVERVVNSLRKRGLWPFDLEPVGTQATAIDAERIARKAEAEAASLYVVHATPAYFARPTHRMSDKKACNMMVREWKLFRKSKKGVGP